MNLRATVLVPAHNEAAVIARTLAPLCPAVDAGVLHVIVIANACQDNTADAARKACPRAVVVETPVAGKTHALNLGQSAAAANLPILCLDADLVVTEAAVLALILGLETGTKAAVGLMQVDASKASPMVQAFQRAWALNPYFANGKFGGIFGLSPEAVAQVFPLPDLTGDDEFIRRSFAPEDVAFVPTCTFVAQSPRTLSSLIATRRRALRGARQVQRLGLNNPSRSSALTMLRASLRSPQQLADLAVFFVVAAAARFTLAIEGKSRVAVWERDLTTRGEGVTL